MKGGEGQEMGMNHWIDVAFSNNVSISCQTNNTICPTLSYFFHRDCLVFYVLFLMFCL